MAYDVKRKQKMPMDALKIEIDKLAREGGFKAAILANEEGLTVVNIESEYDNDALAVLAGFLSTSSKRISNLVGFNKVKHMTMTDPEGNTVICRFFEMFGQQVSLGLITRIDPNLFKIADQAVDTIKSLFSDEG
ncbi:MAG: hypothetical protein HQK76_16785 [Desulfobacterales bacterium]|nr:hypothetical protein [Desulfobacterales bacterium]